MAFLVKMLQGWINDLGLGQLSDEDIYEKLFDCSKLDNDCPKLTINPVLWGERHKPNQTASVRNQTLQKGVQDVFNLQCVLCEDADASVGAALSAM